MSQVNVTWVVYQMVVGMKTCGINAVCEQNEWEEMQRTYPVGCHTLIQSGITSEGEAEKLARGTSGDRRTTLRSRCLANVQKHRRGRRIP
jgi:hypothetical protein